MLDLSTQQGSESVETSEQQPQWNTSAEAESEVKDETTQGKHDQWHIWSEAPTSWNATGNPVMFETAPTTTVNFPPVDSNMLDINFDNVVKTTSVSPGPPLPGKKGSVQFKVAGVHILPPVVFVSFIGILCWLKKISKSKKCLVADSLPLSASALIAVKGENGDAPGRPSRRNRFTHDSDLDLDAQTSLRDIAAAASIDTNIVITDLTMDSCVIDLTNDGWSSATFPHLSGDAFFKIRKTPGTISESIHHNPSPLHLAVGEEIDEHLNNNFRRESAPPALLCANVTESSAQKRHTCEPNPLLHSYQKDDDKDCDANRSHCGIRFSNVCSVLAVCCDHDGVHHLPGTVIPQPDWHLKSKTQANNTEDEIVESVLAIDTKPEVALPLNATPDMVRDLSIGSRRRRCKKRASIEDFRRKHHNDCYPEDGPYDDDSTSDDAVFGWALPGTVTSHPEKLTKCEKARRKLNEVTPGNMSDDTISTKSNQTPSPQSAPPVDFDWLADSPTDTWRARKIVPKETTLHRFKYSDCNEGRLPNTTTDNSGPALPAACGSKQQASDTDMLQSGRCTGRGRNMPLIRSNRHSMVSKGLSVDFGLSHRESSLIDRDCVFDISAKTQLRRKSAPIIGGVQSGCSGDSDAEEDLCASDSTNVDSILDVPRTPHCAQHRNNVSLLNAHCERSRDNWELAAPVKPETTDNENILHFTVLANCRWVTNDSTIDNESMAPAIGPRGEKTLNSRQVARVPSEVDLSPERHDCPCPESTADDLRVIDIL